MTHEGTAQDNPSGLMLIWDGVEYDCPLNLTPREDGRIHSLTGCWGVDILREQLPKLSVLGIAGLLIIAMERRQGRIDADAILDDPKFNEKIEVHVPPKEATDGPPADAAPAAAPELPASPLTTETPSPTGLPT